MKRSQKIEKIRMLYELERLVYKRGKTYEDKKKINQLRKIVDGNTPTVGNPEVFNLEDYLSYKERFPGIKDAEVAKLMGIHKQTLYKAKVRNGLIKSRSKKEGA